MEASARACANIALAKYWGKADRKANVPAVPSISLTLDQLITETRVRFDPSLATDLVRLDGRRASAQTLVVAARTTRKTHSCVTFSMVDDRCERASRSARAIQPRGG